MALARLLLALVLVVSVFTVVFHVLMEREGQSHSWATAVYWVMVVMSTLGFGDITFQSDLGRVFSVFVLLSGSVFMLVLLPFMFIQFFYSPWMEAQAAARAPRQVQARINRHVLVTGLGVIEQSLIRMLKRAEIPYVVLVSELAEALRLHDDGYSVMVGEVDDRDTYLRAGVERAALVVTALKDTTNTNVAFTVREISSSVSVVATAAAPASVDILQLAGCNEVLQLGEMLGQALARRVLGRDAKCHVVGEFEELLIAEAAAAGTPLVGRTLKEIRLAEHARVNVVGVWNRGRFELAGPETLITSTSVLLLAGTAADLEEYDGLFCVYSTSDAPVIIVGGGRVGRATATALSERGVEYRIVERNADRVRVKGQYVIGDAAELDVLKAAGIMTCSSVVITTHDDDINVYLAIYCRRLRSDVQILARANQDRNVSTLHRAGADFVMSYASTGASTMFNLLKRGTLLLLADGLDAFRVPVPPPLIGKTLQECRFRQTTGCNVVAIEQGGRLDTHPAPQTRLAADAELVLVGDAESEQRFFDSLQ
ncbi:Voltage-gated potassium channel Kch [Caulifigura coniformis]|uniref:Voltage-gated potassium channel Kch n=1 Tax=Caulifigura coniformis TaxID=2527983 RepID=A0A517SI31_9PLAN|nr:NAD-binding protein [Caulifigura coniformis]QDT55778.1 Voltage-gated potassium channel Kch [Caulifigura coniformis]